MKKICFLCPKAYPLFNNEVNTPFGGAEAQIALLARELSTYPDIEVSFVVADIGQLPEETFGSIRVLRSFRPEDMFFQKIRRFYEALGKADADIYIQTTLTPFSGAIAWLCRVRGKKFVYRVASDSEIDGRYEKENGWFIGFLSKLVFRCAHLIIAQNALQAKELSRRKMKNVFVLRSGVNVKKAMAPKEDFVLWVGRAVKTKRPELFLQLAQEMPEVKFVMVLAGDPESELHKIMTDQAKDIPNLELYTSLSFGQTEEYFQRAKLFVSTSEMEGFPMVFLQAAVNRVPIVSLSVDPDGMLSEKKCGLYSKGSFSLLKEQIHELLQNGNLYQESGEKGYSYVQKHCSITRIARQWYDKIMAL